MLPVDPQKPLQPLLGPRNDPLKHFTREKAAWKLAALFVDRIPHIVTCLGIAAAAVLGVFYK